MGLAQAAQVLRIIAARLRAAIVAGGHRGLCGSKRWMHSCRRCAAMIDAYGLYPRGRRAASVRVLARLIRRFFL